MDHQTRQAIMEQRNYDNDPRVRAGEEGAWYQTFDEKRMVATILIYDDDDEETLVEVPVRFVVCPTCDGKGSHVNPSIDAGGLTAEDFHDDPDFAEDYMSGTYDVSCYECGGQRVVPEIAEDRLSPDQKAAVESLYERLRWEAEDRATERAERAMGA